MLTGAEVRHGHDSPVTLAFPTGACIPSHARTWPSSDPLARRPFPHLSCPAGRPRSGLHVSSAFVGDSLVDSHAQLPFLSSSSKAGTAETHRLRQLQASLLTGLPG